MAKYKECPNCSNCEPGTNIYVCCECDGFYCEDVHCKGELTIEEKLVDVVWFDDSKRCPHCGHKTDSPIIKYTIPEDEEDEDE